MAIPSRKGDESAPPAWRDVEPALFPRSVLDTHNAVVLDPATALRLPDQGTLRPTVYVADSLIVPLDVAYSAELAKLFQDTGAAIGVDLPELRRDALDRDRDFGRVDSLRVSLVPGRLADGQLPTRGPDAWNLIQRVRAAAPGRALDVLRGVGLDHLLVGCPHLEGHPVTGMAHLEGHPYGIDEYAYAGSGGRAPVSWVGADPDYDCDFAGRRPVVAVLDTGIGQHRWFQEGVRKDLEFRGLHAGLDSSHPDPELTGDIVGPMDGALDSHSGHGTFIAGLIRQICPKAEIVAIRIMGSDGVVQESDLVRAMSVISGTVPHSRWRPAADRHRVACRWATTTRTRVRSRSTRCCSNRSGPSARMVLRSSPVPATTVRRGRCTRPRSTPTTTARSRPSSGTACRSSASAP